jgi:hypothetical protein
MCGSKKKVTLTPFISSRLQHAKNIVQRKKHAHNQLLAIDYSIVSSIPPLLPVRRYGLLVHFSITTRLVRHVLGLRVGLALVGCGKRLPRRPAPDDDGRAVGAVVASLPSPQALLAARRRVTLERLVHQDLLPPALFAAEPLVASVMFANGSISRRYFFPIAEILMYGTYCC